MRHCNRLYNEHQQASIQSCLIWVISVQALLQLRDSCLQACKPGTLNGQSTAMLVMFLSFALYMLHHLVHRSCFAPVLLWGSSFGCRMYVALNRLTQAECVDNKCVYLPRQASDYSWQLWCSTAQVAENCCVSHAASLHSGRVSMWCCKAKPNSPAMSSLSAFCCMLPSRLASGLDPAPPCLTACAVACCG